MNDDIPSMIKIPLNHYDLACPHCKQVMREKDFSFKWSNGNIWTHTCDPDKPFKMPINESYEYIIKDETINKFKKNIKRILDLSLINDDIE